MCGRINVSDHEGLTALLAMMGMHVWPLCKPQFNVPPTSAISVVSTNAKSQALCVDTMHWGFATASTPNRSRNVFNARYETVFQKPTFSPAARHHRAIVPINGYYEWQRRDDGSKQPFHITSQSGRALALAAITQPATNKNIDDKTKRWGSATNVSEQLSFDLGIDEPADSPMTQEDEMMRQNVCLLTMPACEQTNHVHHRMPVIVDINQAARWISDGDETLLGTFISVKNSQLLRVTQVSQHVSNASNDGPECTKAAKKA